jgi:catechol 2,3-dioxygenase-like lactoylglutathione lyase family enzyme
MIDHISIPVRDLKASARFYEALLAPLGMTRVVERSTTIGFGKTYPEFWLNVRVKLEPQPEDSGAHIALRAPSTEAVDAFHAAALAAGAHSDGTPGMRLEYSTHYYAAFVRDWDGNRVEAVTFLRDPA